MTDQDLVSALPDALRAVDAERHRIAQQELGLNTTDLTACGYLAAQGIQTPSELARYLGITTASVTALLDRLEAQERVWRVKHPADRRKLLIGLTPAGERTVAHAQAAFAATFEECAADLNADERQLVLRFLRRVAAARGMEPSDSGLPIRADALIR